ncbi:unnamed protein product [Darwinula stevensoni]|uniref:Ig-like domain-containing protein n=1 Tax=Darwinula stevensoni TaxID=69355 RepID=A0A7R8X4S7_9CRUS|nr:unnamed protein product [Darwinula stevensoni]CAG0883979.1 unnamed protein product [Darwinula stevensoni]
MQHSASLGDSDSRRLSLRNVSLATSGRYRCEVSAEAPSFQTVKDSFHLQIYVLPSRGPVINGVLDYRRLGVRKGDELRLNCSCHQSAPPTSLSWFINDHKVHDKHVLEYPPREEGELMTSVLGLRIKMEERHMAEHALRVKCVASLDPVFWRSQEESFPIIQDFPLPDDGSSGVAVAPSTTGKCILSRPSSRDFQAPSQLPLPCILMKIRLSRNVLHEAVRRSERQ